MRRGGSCVILMLLIGDAARAQSANGSVEAERSAASPSSGELPGGVDVPRIALLATHTSGIDAAVARYVDRALQRGAAALGFAAVDRDQTLRMQQALPLAPPTLGDLWQLTHRLGADAAVSALASAGGGLYTVELRVASRDGRGPFFARGQASHLELEAEVERLLGQALAQRAASASGGDPAAERRAQPASTPALPAVRLALHNDVAFGLADDPFVNEVLGVRADVRLDVALWFGLHVGYANLPGRERRVHGVLPYAQLEQRIALAEGRAVAVPLRLAVGYLLRNGGVLRVSSGIAVPLGQRSELVLDLLAPTFWTTPDKTLFSLSAGAELAVEL